MKEDGSTGACVLLFVIAGLGAVFALSGLHSADASGLGVTEHKIESPTNGAWVDGALTGLGPWPSRKRFAEALGGEVPFFLCLVFLSAVLMRCAKAFRRAGGLLVIAALV